MSNHVRRRRLPLTRRPALIPDPGQMVDLQMEDGSWRQGFRALSAPSTAETGEVLIWVCTEDEYREARREERRAVAHRTARIGRAQGGGEDGGLQGAQERREHRRPAR